MCIGLMALPPTPSYHMNRGVRSKTSTTAIQFQVYVLTDGIQWKNVCSRRVSYSDLNGRPSTNTDIWSSCQFGYNRCSIVVKNSSLNNKKKNTFEKKKERETRRDAYDLTGSLSLPLSLIE